MAKATSTPNFDFTKFASDFKIPGFDADALMAAQKRNFDAMVAANQLVAEGFQAVVCRQGDIYREGFETATAKVKELTDAPQADTATKQAEITKAAFERSVANGKELGDMMVKAVNDAGTIMNQRVTEGLDEVKGFVKA